MNHWIQIGLLMLSAGSLATSAFGDPQERTAAALPRACTGWVRTQDGRDVEGTLATPSLRFAIDGEQRSIAVQDLLSFHSGAPASAHEAERIVAALAALAGSDAQAAAAASAELVEIGLPVLTPLLKSYVDTDAHEPDPRYRLFARIVPGHADAMDRSLDLIRLAGGEALRGKLDAQAGELVLTDADRKEQRVPLASVRRLAIRQASVERAFEMQALDHCTYVGFLDTGIALRPTSSVRVDAAGFARLSFDEDGWAADPDGIREPLPGKRKLQEGFRWGALLGRVGASGERWFAGKHAERGELSSGQLYFAINDNEHWQNNIGSYRVRLRVSDAYDLAEPR